MGSTQKEVQNKIRKRIKISAFILVPFILIGGLSIAYQFSTGGLQSFDFKIGKLWSWATNNESDEKEQVQEVKGIITPSIQAAIAQAVPPPRTIVPVEVKPVIKQVVVGSVIKSLDNLEGNRAPFKTIEVAEMRPEKTFNYFKSGRHIDLQQKEYLIPQDIKPRRSRFAIGASFAPGISYRRLGYNDINSVARIDNSTAYTFGQSKEYRNKHDKAIMNFYSGIDIYAHVSNRWSIQTGFYYSNYGEKLTVVKKTDPNEINSNPSQGSAFISKKSVFESPEMVEYEANEELPFSNYYGFMEVPVVASYQMVNINEMLGVNVQIGASYGYLDHADVLMYNYETNKYFWIPSSDFALINKHFLNGIFGVELSQYISKEIEVFANPQFKYAFTNTFKRDYEIKQNQWATGIRLGMKVHM